VIRGSRDPKYARQSSGHRQRKRDGKADQHHGDQPAEIVRDAYRSGWCAVNLSPVGLFDKAALEAIACAIPVIVVWLAWRQELGTGLKARAPLGHVWRGVVGTTAMGLGFAGLGYLPLPEVTAIGYAAPLLVVVFAAMVSWIFLLCLPSMV